MTRRELSFRRKTICGFPLWRQMYRIYNIG